MSLVNLYQLKKMSDALQAYDADKVKTKVRKPGEDADAYTVEELFQKTKQDIEDVSKSFEALRSKKIWGVIRLSLPVSKGQVEFPKDLDDRIPNIDRDIALPAYSSDNKLYMDDHGKPVKVNMATGILSGTPVEVDEGATTSRGDGTTVYRPIAVTSLKVFPMGEWTLDTLPDDALISNDELQVISYKSAIDRIVKGLSNGTDIVDYLKEQVGVDAIHNALKEKVSIKDLYTVTADGVKTPLYRAKTDKITRADLNDPLEKIASGEEKLETDVAALKTSMDDIQEARKAFLDDTPVVIKTPAAWEIDHAYKLNDVVSFDSKNYICKKSHTSSADVKPVKYGGNWIQLNDGQKIFGYLPYYSQVEKLDVAATAEKPVAVDITMNKDEAFCMPPIEVLVKAASGDAWEHAPYGDSYTYSQPDAETLRVQFIKSGSYRINYSAGFKREEY